MPVSGPRTHQSWFLAVFLLNYCIGLSKLVHRGELDQEAPVVDAITNSVFSKGSFPGLRVPVNSGIEVTMDKNLVICRGAV